MRNEYMKYVHDETEPNQVTIKVEQVNLGAQWEKGVFTSKVYVFYFISISFPANA